MRHKWQVIGVLVVVLLGVAALKLSPMGPGPDLPAGATRLHIATEAPHLLPTFGCETALLGPARVASDADNLILVTESSDKTVVVVWPSGWAAWRIGGQAELVGRDGSVVAHEGDVLSDLGGGVGIDNAFHVCIIGG